MVLVFAFTLIYVTFLWLYLSMVTIQPFCPPTTQIPFPPKSLHSPLSFPLLFEKGKLNNNNECEKQRIKQETLCFELVFLGHNDGQLKRKKKKERKKTG